MYDELHQSFNAIHPLTEDAWEDLSALLKPMDLDRNAFLVKAGDIARDCYVLTEGVIRVYNSKDGNEYNKTFFVPGMFPTPLTALLTNQPSQFSFQALLPSKVIRFNYEQYCQLFEKHRCLESFMRRILEMIWIKKEQHDIRMVMNDATTNYLIFRETYPDLENQIPQYHIASYLGITPIQLSRVRAQLAKKV